MITLEQIVQLAMLWYEAEVDYDEREKHHRPLFKAALRSDRRRAALEGALRDYKLLHKEER